MAIPNTAGVEVAQHQSKVYSGQYSADGNFLYVSSFRIFFTVAEATLLQLRCVASYASLHLRHAQRPSDGQQVGARHSRSPALQLHVQDAMAPSLEYEDDQDGQSQSGALPVDGDGCHALGRQSILVLFVRPAFDRDRFLTLS